MVSPHCCHGNQAYIHIYIYICVCVFFKGLQHSCHSNSLPLDLLVIALTTELLDVLFAEALLSLTLLLEDLYGLVERLDGRSLHLDLLRGEDGEKEDEDKCQNIHIKIVDCKKREVTV